MTDGLSITGGAACLDAQLDDLLAAAALLDSAGDDLREAAAAVSLAAADPALLAAGTLCPVEAVTTELALLDAIAGSRGVGRWGLVFETVAVGLRATVATYRAAEEASAAAFSRLRWGAAELGGGVIAGLAGSPALWGGVTGLGAVDAVSDGGVRRALGSTLYAAPALTEQAVAVAPAVIDGVIVPSLGGGAIRGLPRPPGPLDPLDVGTSRDGYADLLHRVMGLGGGFGALLDHDPFRVVPVPADPETDPIPPATTVTDLLREQAVLGDGRHDGMLTVRRVAGSDGEPAWIVQIPGTQDWSLGRTGTPLDLTSDVRLMAGERSELTRCVSEALRRAGVTAGEPILLAGHSLGGIAAGALAADPAFLAQFTVTAVVTVGAPVARFAIADEISVLSIEHAEDLVPMLDGERNPATDHWVTVRRELDASTGDPGADFAAAHGTSGYVQTAALVDSSADAGVSAWRDQVSRFFVGSQAAVRYRIVPEPS